MECPKKKYSYCFDIDNNVYPEFCKECNGKPELFKHKGLNNCMPVERANEARILMVCADCEFSKECQTRLCEIREGVAMCKLGLWKNPVKNENLVSIIISSRNEKYLNATIVSCLAMAKGNVEIVVVADGPVYEPVCEFDNVKVIHHKDIQGRRPSIDEAVIQSSGEYLLHIDGHMKPDVYGYDIELINIIKKQTKPTMLLCNLTSLDVNRWRSKEWGMGHKYIDENLRDKWSDYRPKEAIEPTMCNGGASWFLSKDYYNALGGCDRTLADIWGSFGVEWGLKVWLSDPDGKGSGQVLLCKDIKFSHMFKNNGVEYKTPGADNNRNVLKKWVDGRGENQVISFKEIQKKFSYLYPSSKEPMVTVLMNTNGLNPELIEEAIESFNRQTYTNKILKIFNTNPSKLEIVDKPENIQIYNCKQFESFPHQLANGVKSVETPYWCVMDSDDIYLPNHIKQLVDAIHTKKYDYPHCYLVPRAWQDNRGKIEDRPHGWWSALYSKIDNDKIDEALEIYRKTYKKQSGFDKGIMNLFKRINLKCWERTAIYRIGKSLNISCFSDTNKRYAYGIKQSQDNPLTKPLNPHWDKPYDKIFCKNYKYKTKNIFTSMSISSIAYDFLVDYVIDNNIKSIIEFGPGASTWAFKENNCKVDSFEYKDKWIDIYSKDFNVIKFKNSAEIAEQSPEKFYDMAFIDGPRGLKDGSPSRLNSCKYASTRTNRILLHDCKRAGEQKTIDIFVKDGWDYIYDKPSDIGILTKLL